jgi:hypothetical protein
MAAGPIVLPILPLEKRDLSPEVDDTIRSLFGDSYPDNIYLIYLPQRVCHAFYIGDAGDDTENKYHWVLAFTDDGTAHQWAMATARVRRAPMGVVRERVELHQHALAEACELVKRAYPTFHGLMIIHRDGRQVRHYVR